MAAQPNTLQTRFTANIVQFENELRRLTRLNQRAAANVAVAHQRAAAQSNSAWANSNIGGALQRSMAGIGPMLKQYAGLIAGMFAGREAYNAVETYQRFANSLKVAGLQGAALDKVQKQLYDSAIKNGVALEPLGQLYARASQYAKELGANQNSLLKFTDGISSALRVAGATTESASGALMQLSQALGSGTVHAEEFNSINESARPILEGVALGNAKYGGSVTKLRAEMLKGKLSAKDFYDSFIAGSAQLEARAAKAPLTVAASMTNLQTALTRYIGEANEAWGITDKVTYAIKMMADNFDVVAKSVGVVGAVYAATFVPGLVRGTVALGVGTIATLKSTAATITDTVALVTRTAAIYGISTASATATVATRALGTAMAFFGGPIGLAIMAVAAAVAYLGVTSAKAALETSALNERINANAAALDAAHAASVKKRAETGNLTDQEYKSAVATASLTGEVGKLTNAYYLAAAAAKALAVQQANTEKVSAQKDMNAARGGYQDRVAVELNHERMANTSSSGPGSVHQTPLTAQQQKQAYQRANASPEGLTFRKSIDVTRERDKTVRDLAAQKLDDFGAAPVAPTSTKKTGGKKTGGGSKPKDPTDASEDAIDAAERAYQQAMQNSAETAEERHGYALTLLKMDRDDQVKQLDRRAAEGDITKAAAASAKALVEKTYLQNVENADNVKRDEVAARENEITEQTVALRADGLKLEADRLDGLADSSKDMRVRHKYEREALDKRQKADDEAFQVQQDLLALDRLKRGYTRDQVAAMRKAAEDNREGQKRNETATLERSQTKDAPKGVGERIEEYAKSFGTLNDQLSNIATGAIDNLTSGLTDAIMGAKSFKEAFSDMAKSVIAQLIQMAVKFAIMEALGAAFGVKGLGRATLGLDKADKNAMGTTFAPGGLSIVGEKGPELTYLPRGSQVLPNNLLKNFTSPTNGGGTSNNTTINNNINATDAVLTGWVKEQVYEGSMQAVQQSNRVVNRGLQKRGSNRLGR